MSRVLTEVEANACWSLWKDQGYRDHFLFQGRLALIDGEYLAWMEEACYCSMADSDEVDPHAPTKLQPVARSRTRFGSHA
jgi:hypothetical protein